MIKIIGVPSRTWGRVGGKMSPCLLRVRTSAMGAESSSMSVLDDGLSSPDLVSEEVEGRGLQNLLSSPQPEVHPPSIVFSCFTSSSLSSFILLVGSFVLFASFERREVFSPLSFLLPDLPLVKVFSRPDNTLSLETPFSFFFFLVSKPFARSLSSFSVF